MENIREKLIKKKKARLIVYRIVGWTGVIATSSWYFRSVMIGISMLIVAIVCCMKIPINPFVSPEDFSKEISGQ